MAHQRISVIVFVVIFLSFGCKKEDSVTSNSKTPTENLSSISNKSRLIDIDGNSSIDFRFSYKGIQTTDYPSSSLSWFLEVQGENTNQIQFNYPNGSLVLQDGVKIDSSRGWTEYSSSLASIGWNRSRGWDSSWSGSWIGVGERNLGIRLAQHDGYCYGWIKLSVDSKSGKLKIIDSAYQTISNKSIFAGIHP